jgi:hypothetical protein
LPHGEHTARVARALRQSLSARKIDILFDHGEQGVDPTEYLGEIVSWYGPQYGTEARLALLDIAVVWRNGDRAAALIEIEESSATPKVILGDLTAMLFGDQLTFQGQRRLKVGAWTTLIVLVPIKSDAKRRQVAELARRMEAIRVSLHSGNASIGRVRVGTYGDASDLEQVVEGLVREALGDGSQR